MKFAVSPRLPLRRPPRLHPAMPGLPQLLLSYLTSSPLLVAGNVIQAAYPSVSGLLQFNPTCPRSPGICPSSPAGLRFFHSSTEGRTHPHFTYHIAASYSAKGHRLNFDRNIFNHNPSVQWKSGYAEPVNSKPHKAKRPASGQDAFFVNGIGDSSSIMLGIADGVGGWTESGVDPADFAHSLCDYMALGSSRFPEDFKSSTLRPKDLLQLGYQQVMKDDTVLGGGSTACVASADPDGHVEVANLGDSGFIHLGLNAVRFFSDPQTHAFNTPYQLSKIPKQMLLQMRLFGGASALADYPKDANVTNHHVKHGDVLVFATDGVWDNLSPQDVLSIISRSMFDSGAWLDADHGLEVNNDLKMLTTQPKTSNFGQNTLQGLLALAIAKEAKEASLNQKRDGPFAKEVHKFYPGERYHGGKPDDICIVVVVAVEDTV